MFKTRKRKKHSRVKASAVAAVTAAGVMVGGAFSSPEEVLEDSPTVIVQTLNTADAEPEIDADGGPDVEEEPAAAEEETEEKRGVRAAVRRVVRMAPAPVRALVALPLWAIGTVVLALVSSLWTGLLSPAAAAVLSWLGVALMAALVFTLAMKTAFPDLPLKKIRNKRSLLCIGVLCLIFGILDAALPFFWEDYERLSRLLKILGSLVCVGVPVAFFLRRHKRREPEVIVAEPVEVPAPEPELTMEQKEAAAKKRVIELADSVCPRA